MVLKWYQTIETLLYADMSAMMSLIENHTDLNTYTVKCMNPLELSPKENSDDNSMWDESMNGPHKEGYWLV